VKKIYLSYILNENTPSYGNRNQFIIKKKSDISKGDVANDSYIETTVHIGTHIDMPYHFFENGQTIENFSIDFWFFEKVLYIEVSPKQLVINEELIEKLQSIDKKDQYELLIVKTGIGEKRGEDVFWKENYGFSPEIADYLRREFSNIRVFGFDSVSVSSFANRMIGRKAHKAFLDTKQPILLLEDMDLTDIDTDTVFKSIHISPLRIAKCDGVPCTVIAEVA